MTDLGQKNYLTFDLDLWPLHTYMQSVAVVLRYLHTKYELDMLRHWKDQISRGYKNSFKRYEHLKMGKNNNNYNLQKIAAQKFVWPLSGLTYMPRKYEIDIKCNWDDIVSCKWNGYLTFDHDLCLWYMCVA